MISFKQGELRASQRYVVFAPKDDDGTPTAVQNPVFQSSNDAIFGVGDAVIDGLKVKCPILPGGLHTVGVAQLRLISDVDLGPGEVPLTYDIDIEVRPDNATGFDITVE